MFSSSGRSNSLDVSHSGKRLQISLIEVFVASTLICL